MLLLSNNGILNVGVWITRHHQDINSSALQQKAFTNSTSHLTIVTKYYLYNNNTRMNHILHPTMIGNNLRTSSFLRNHINHDFKLITSLDVENTICQTTLIIIIFIAHYFGPTKQVTRNLYLEKNRGII